MLVETRWIANYAVIRLFKLKKISESGGEQETDVEGKSRLSKEL